MLARNNIIKIIIWSFFNVCTSFALSFHCIGTFNKIFTCSQFGVHFMLLHFVGIVYTKIASRTPRAILTLKTIFQIKKQEKRPKTTHWWHKQGRRKKWIGRKAPSIVIYRLFSIQFYYLNLFHRVCICVSVSFFLVIDVRFFSVPCAMHQISAQLHCIHKHTHKKRK